MSKSTKPSTHEHNQFRAMMGTHGCRIGPGKKTIFKAETPSKYSGKKLRQLRAERGVGSVRRIARRTA